MGESTLVGGVDTWADAAKPSKNRAEGRHLKVRSNAAMAYLYFARPMPLGAVVTEAKLRLRLTAARSAGGTLSLHRLRESLRASRVTWNARPGVASGATSGTIRTGPVGTWLEIDLKSFMQQVSDGQPWYGLRIQSASTAVLQVGSSDGTPAYRPELYVAWSEAPHAPDPQSPVAGQAVSVASPVLRFQVTDLFGDTTIASAQVEIATDPDFTTDLWTSAWASTNGLAEVNLAGASWGWAAASQGTPYYWRVRVRDGAGLESGWSQDAEFCWVPHYAVTILNPAENDPFVTEPTPPILWAVDGTQAQWQVDIVDADNPGTVLANSTPRPGTETEWTVSPALTATGPFVVTVRSWDNVERDPTDAYQPVSRTFDKRDDPSVTGAAGLVVNQPSPWPGVRLEWTRATAPDSWVIERDGKVIAAEEEPGDLLVEGTTYRYTDPAAQSWQRHTWAVKAVVNGKQSTSATVEHTPTMRGIWLIDEGRDLHCWLAGDDEGTWTQPEDATAVAPLGSSKVVRRVQGLRNREGSLAGQLVDAYGRSAAEYAADLDAMRRDPIRAVVLAVADFSLQVQIGNVTTAPTPTNPPGRTVAFDYWEV